MASSDDTIDELMEKCKNHEDPTGRNGFLEQLFRTTLCYNTNNELPGYADQPSEVKRPCSVPETVEDSTSNGNIWRVTFRDVKHAAPGVIEIV